jgi:hypothetical protein
MEIDLVIGSLQAALENISSLLLNSQGNYFEVLLNV